MNTFTITARDAAGHIGTDVIAVTRTDNEPPTVAIASPTAAATHATGTSTLNLAGTASDAFGIAQVAWANNRGGGGTASGTTAWSVAGIALKPGENVITVTARDTTGSTATDVLTVTRDRRDRAHGHDRQPDQRRKPLDHRQHDCCRWHGQRRLRRDAGHLGEQPWRFGYRVGHERLVDRLRGVATG